MNAEKLTIPVHNNRVSPLFDVAGKFVLVDTEIPKEKLFLLSSNISGMSRVEKLKESKVTLVICSAISMIYARALYSCGIDLMPGVAGDIDEIIEAYLNNRLFIDQI